MQNPLALTDPPKHRTTGFGGTIPSSGKSASMIQARHTNRYEFIQQTEAEKENGLIIKQVKAIVQSPQPGDIGK